MTIINAVFLNGFQNPPVCISPHAKTCLGTLKKKIQSLVFNNQEKIMSDFSGFLRQHLLNKMLESTNT